MKSAKDRQILSLNVEILKLMAKELIEAGEGGLSSRVRAIAGELEMRLTQERLFEMYKSDWDISIEVAEHE